MENERDVWNGTVLSSSKVSPAQLPTNMQIQQTVAPEGDNTDNSRNNIEIEGGQGSTSVCEVHNVAWPVAWKLFLSHFLSTWNSRSFEFGAVLFLGVVYPGTLLNLSVYAIVRSASTIVLASYIGRAIDQRARLPVVQSSIGT